MLEDAEIDVNEGSLIYNQDDTDIVAMVPEFIFTVGVHKHFLTKRT